MTNMVTAKDKITTIFKLANDVKSVLVHVMFMAPRSLLGELGAQDESPVLQLLIN
jgi:hypothetical protein